MFVTRVAAGAGRDVVLSRTVSTGPFCSAEEPAQKEAHGGILPLVESVTASTIPVALSIISARNGNGVEMMSSPKGMVCPGARYIWSFP